MAKKLLPDDLWAEIAPLLPVDRARPKGRTRRSRYDALIGILFVLYTAIPWERLPLAYNCERCRNHLRARSITPRIARRGIESSRHLGKHRRVVERTFAWLNQFRRLDTSAMPTSTEPSSCSRRRHMLPNPQTRFC